MYCILKHIFKAVKEMWKTLLCFGHNNKLKMRTGQQWLKLKTYIDYLENQKQWATKFPDAKRLKEGNKFHNMVSD